MKKIIAVAMLAVSIILIGCGGKNKKEEPKNQPLKSSSITGNPEEPTWVSMGGAAFDDNMKAALYGVGVVSNIKNPSLAIPEAKSRAREDLANNLGTFVTALRERYMSSISELTDDKAGTEEQMVRQTGKEFVAEYLTGATIMSTWHDANSNMWFSLAKMTFDSKGVAEKFKSSVKPVVQERIKQNAEEALKRLDQTVDNYLKTGVPAPDQKK